MNFMLVTYVHEGYLNHFCSGKSLFSACVLGSVIFFIYFVKCLNLIAIVIK